MTNIPKPNKRPPMFITNPPRTNGKTYYQLCVLLEDYKNGIWSLEEVVELIFRLFRKD